MRCRSPSRSDFWVSRFPRYRAKYRQSLNSTCRSDETMVRLGRYISLHTRCLRLLRTLRTALDDQLRDHFGPRYIDDERNLCYVVYYIFGEATEPKRSGGTANPKNIFESSMLKEASKVVEKYIKQEGSMECDKLEKTCLCWSRNESLCLRSEEAKSMS